MKGQEGKREGGLRWCERGCCGRGVVNGDSLIVNGLGDSLIVNGLGDSLTYLMKNSPVL